MLAIDTGVYGMCAGGKCDGKTDSTNVKSRREAWTGAGATAEGESFIALVSLSRFIVSPLSSREIVGFDYRKNKITGALRIIKQGRSV